MAVTYPNKRGNMYIGNMLPEQIDCILSIREQKVIPSLKRMIFNFPPELVLESLERGISIRDILGNDPNKLKEYLGELRDYQTVGTAFMYMSPRSMLGDGVGAGKTAEIGALLNYLKLKGELTRFVMAVETSALGQTQCELMKFTGLNIVGMPATAYKIRKVIKNTDWTKVDGIVIRHSTLRSDILSKWFSLYLDEMGLSKLFNTFILDESSVIKNRGTKMFNYTSNICNIASRVHLLNATSFETHLMDIYNQMDICYPMLLPKKWRIEKQFCCYGTKKYWTKVNGQAKLNFARDMKGYKNQADFKESLKLVYFGRSKKEVGKELPHTYLVYEVEPTTDQSLALAKGYRYMEVLNAPSLIPEINIATTKETVPKLERLVELVQTEFQNMQVMVYCFHIEAQEAIYSEMVNIGRKPVVLNGSNTDDERTDIIRKFNSLEYDVIITNIQKSLNLYSGDVCIFYSMEGNPARMEQIRGRIDRSVDDRLKTYVLLLYKGTDEYKFFVDIASQRSKDARELTIDAKTAVDFFIEQMEV